MEDPGISLPSQSQPMNDVSDSKNKKKHKEPTQKKPDLMDKLSKDGKLTPQECQQCTDGSFCLLCTSNGHMIKDCPKSMQGQAAQATDTMDKSMVDAMDESTTNTSKAKKLVSNPETSGVALTQYTCRWR